MLRANIALLRRVFWPRGVLCAVAVFGCCMLFTRLMVARYVDCEAERLLTNDQEDLHKSYLASIDQAFSYTANAIIDELRTVTPLSNDEMRRLARVYGLDEINLADTNGVWVASSEEGVVGRPLAEDPHTAAFLPLLRLDISRVVQDFRRSVTHPDRIRKYVGLSFDDNSGILQIGLDAERAVRDFERIYGNFVADWFIEDLRYFIVAREDGTVFECGRFPHTDVRTLAEIGYDMDRVPADATKTFRQVLFGEPCRCRERAYYNYRFIIVLPDSFFADFVGLTLTLTRVILLFVIVIFAVLHFGSERRRIELAARDEEAARRRQSDLQMARSIQMSALPAVFPPYPRDFMMDVFARMDPARDVGGDFYDFHYVGNDRLAFLVADVSGKGVPAAMFMMKAKTILQALTLSVADLSDAVAAANDYLNEGNDADMFVTCWLGVLDEQSGRLRYVNAGHNPPYICRAATGDVEPLASVSGLVLGGMKGLRYKTYETRLEPGDLLFLYTDGVTEAHNPFNELFDDARLTEVLRGERGLGLARFKLKRDLPTPKQICSRMRAAVDAFAGRTPQFDDITMLALRYRGLPTIETKTVPAEMASVPVLNAFAEAALNRAGCPSAAKADLLVALDEMANNVASYSGARTMTLSVETAHSPDVARLRLVDDGTPWNPLDHLDPDVTLSAEERDIGGLGILMVKKLMDDVAYVRRDGCNQFSVRKSFARGGYA